MKYLENRVKTNKIAGPLNGQFEAVVIRKPAGVEMITKEQMDIIRGKHLQAKKDFKNRCFLLIETLVGGDIVYDDIEKMKSDIYRIAHVGSGTCGNEHKDWVNEVEEMFTVFEKAGLL